MSELLAFHMNDVHYSSDNHYDIPTLDINLQSYGILGNLRQWGNASRKTPRPGDTYAFYCSDYKFTALIKHPEGIPLSQCAAIVEPKFSTTSRMPTVTGLYGIYQKRKIARFAQTFGIKTLVDLTVDPKFANYNLLGIPRGWQTYCVRATKYYGTQLLLDAWTLALEHSNVAHPSFTVYGGGAKVQTLVQEYHWDWEPENMSNIKA